MAGAGVHEAQGPPLELVAVLLGEGGGAAGVGGLADDLVGAQAVAEAVVEAVTDQGDGEVGDIDADPAAVETLGGDGGGAAAALGHYVLRSCDYSTPARAFRCSRNRVDPAVPGR